MKGPNLIKGIHLEGLREIGDPQDFATKYYNQGADELIYMDIVASLYGRRISEEIIIKASKNIFVPLTVGGGIRSISDVELLLRSGADKIAVNTAAVKNPNLLKDISTRFGSQCLVLSIEAKRQNVGKWEVYTDCGREKSGLDVIEWSQYGIKLGIGEILLTSIDNEGTNKGFDNELIKKVHEKVNVPLIVSGGFGKNIDFLNASNSGADGIAIADSLHYEKTNINKIREYAIDMKIPVRDLQK